jgi:hypothetical protein
MAKKKSPTVAPTDKRRPGPRPGLVRTTIDVDPTTLAALKARGARKDMSLGETVTWLVKELCQDDLEYVRRAAD